MTVLKLNKRLIVSLSEKKIVDGNKINITKPSAEHLLSNFLLLTKVEGKIN